MSKKIIITIGHGKANDGKTYDSGAVSKDRKYHEFKIAREIGKYAQEYYNKHYAEQCDLMNYDGSLSLQARINKLKDNTYDFIAEIHLNAGGGTGTECYYHHQSTRGKRYAEAITKNIASTFSITNRGAKIKLNSNGNDYFGIIRSTKPCAVLVETVFIDTDNDLGKVKTTDGQKKCGEAIAKAIASVRGLTEKKPSVDSPTKPATPKPLPEKKTYKKGDAIQLSNTPLYATSTTSKVSARKTGTYYLYDGVKINGRYRVTNKLSNCGRRPAGLYTTGWVKI